MRAEFITTDDARWREALSRLPHDVYHAPEYVELAAEEDGGRPLAFLAEEGGARLLVPLVERPLPPPLAEDDALRDAASPYGYASPTATPGADAAALRRLGVAFVEAAHARGIVSAFLRLHPLLPWPEEALGPWGALVEQGKTIYLDLATSDEEAYRQMRLDVRRGIRRLDRLGYTARMDEWDRLDAFVRVYHDTMKRVGAHPRYLFPLRYFERMRDRLGDRVHLGTVLSPEGDVAAAGLFLVADGIVQFHLSGTDRDHVKVAPSKLLVETGRRWAKARGHRVLHLGGGLGGRADSLYAFKQGFSPLSAAYRTLRVVVDKERYGALVRRRGAEPRPADDPDSFFPAYRA